MNDIDRTVTSDTYRNHVIAVTVVRGPRGAWLPRVSIARDEAGHGRVLPGQHEPEWPSEAEAVRAGLARGREVIDAGEAPPPARAAAAWGRERRQAPRAGSPSPTAASKPLPGCVPGRRSRSPADAAPSSSPSPPPR
ncbi:DUF6566 family protein [Burkholderia sp. SJZ115]